MTPFLRRHDVVRMSYLLILGALALAIQDLCGLLGLALGVTSLVFFGAPPSARRYTRRALFLSVVILLVNPLFNHRGNSLLIEWAGRRFTLEALQVGLSQALSLYALLLIFQLWYHWVSHLAFLRQARRLLPHMALVLTLAIAFVPRLERQYEEVRLAQLSLDVNEGKGRWSRLMGLGERLTTVLSWALEDGMHIAHTFRLKGYDVARGRSQAWTMPLLPLDKILLAFQGGCVCLGLWLWQYVPSVAFYPTYYGWCASHTPVVVIVFVAIGVLYGSLPYWFSWVYRRHQVQCFKGEGGGSVDHSA